MPRLPFGLFTAVSLVLGTLIPVGGLMRPAEAITINLDIDVSLDRKPISPHVYGLNFAKESFANEIDLPVRRWGGNLLTRYNWQNGMANTAADYYFENLPTTNAFDWSVLETHIGWIGQNRRTGTDSLITIPMIGYVAKDGTSCGFRISLYGSQQDSDPFEPDCGNGILPTGQPLTGNNPLDTSTATTAAYMQSWVANLVTTYGSAGSGGVRFYNLDNEPDLWHETHRDVHPSPQTYAELLSRTLSYAAAIKAADPTAQTLGYTSFGWTGFFYSANDAKTAEAHNYNCPTLADCYPDLAANGLYQVEWYLSQLNQYDQQAGNPRLLDYLDLHFYPQNGVALATAGGSTKQALRLRSVRALWDPTYRDESWIGGADQDPDQRYVRLIPRMRAWVSTYYPGTKLAVTEYNFGGLEHINGALAQADILGIFGREGLDLATLWNYPSSADGLDYDTFETLPGAYAFRVYRNYDGAGGKFGDTSVQAISANQSQLAIYAAQRTADSAVTLVIINKTGGTLTGNVGLANFTPGTTAEVYRYSTADLHAVVHQPTAQAVGATGFVANFPANSVTLVVVPLGTGGGGWNLVSPANGASIPNNRPTFDWDDYPNAMGYNLQISKVPDFATVLKNVTVGSSPSSYTPTTDLLAKTLLYWRVRPKLSSTTYGAWSPVWSFTSANPPSVPTLVSPANNALVAGPSPLFDWRNSTVTAPAVFSHYQIQIARNASFTDIAYDGTRSGASNSSTNLAVLTPAATYYWRVRSFASDGDYSGWSAVRKVRVQFTAPALTSPANGATNTVLRPQLKWVAMTGVTGYNVQISTSSTFSSVAVNANVTVAQFTPASNLLAQTVYFWRVRANGAYGPGAWSIVRSFTTQ